MRLHLGITDEESERSAESLIEAIISTSNESLRVAAEKGNFGAHEALNGIRHNIVVRELKSIQSNLGVLRHIDRTSLSEIEQFAVDFCNAMLGKYRHIQSPDIYHPRRIALDQLYVSPMFVRLSMKGSIEDEVGVKSVLQSLHRMVVLGNPGGGKSTFARRLSLGLAESSPLWLVQGRRWTPILVVLRDYSSLRSACNCSLLKFIKTSMSSTFSTPPPEGAVEYLLLNGRAVVIFDGLDEVTNTLIRQEIRDEVEQFCGKFPNAPILVTSRETGYSQAPLSSEFDVYRLSSFTDSQISEYVNRWFKTIDGILSEEAKRQSVAFLKESEGVPDLRSNPLILALMCNIYRGENYIPQNRPAIYDKCAMMLFETWDRSRGIAPPFAYEALLLPVLRDLAYWIYSDDSLQSGVPELRLREKIAGMLFGWRTDNMDEARQVARDIIDFTCRGRAWVFMDTGHEIYQFAHRTFLEYFAAHYVVATEILPEKIVARLLPKIAKREWDVVAQIACQIVASRVDRGDDHLIDSLMEQCASLNEDERSACLSFLARSLSLISPGPSRIRSVAEMCVKFAADSYARSGMCRLYVGPIAGRWGRREGAESVVPLFFVPPARFKFMEDVIVSTFAEMLESAVSQAQDNIAQLVLMLNTMCIFVGHHYGNTANATRVTSAIVSRTSLVFEGIAKRSIPVALQLYDEGECDIENVIVWHGLESLFCTYEFDPPGIIVPSIGILLMSKLIGLGRRSEFDRVSEVVNSVECVGRMVSESDFSPLNVPECDSIGIELLEKGYQMSSPSWEGEIRNIGDFVVGAFFIFAVYSELLDRRLWKMKDSLADLAEQNQPPVLQAIATCLRTRDGQYNSEYTEAVMNAFDLSERARQYISRWIRHEADMLVRSLKDEGGWVPHGNV